METSFVDTTSRKISGQKYLVLGFLEGGGEELEQGGDFRAERRSARRARRSERKVASLPISSSQYRVR